jgi:hypothetical protein
VAIGTGNKVDVSAKFFLPQSTRRTDDYMVCSLPGKWAAWTERNLKLLYCRIASVATVLDMGSRKEHKTYLLRFIVSERGELTGNPVSEAITQIFMVLLSSFTVCFIRV